MIENEYTHDKKKKLASKIKKIHNINYLKNIRDIIKHYNPDVQITKNSKGVLLLFDKLTDGTYIHLEKYIHEINETTKKIEII